MPPKRNIVGDPKNPNQTDTVMPDDPTVSPHETDNEEEDDEFLAAFEKMRLQRKDEEADRTYFYVSMTRKDKFKALKSNGQPIGALFDGAKKLWYVSGKTPEEIIAIEKKGWPQITAAKTFYDVRFQDLKAFEEMGGYYLKGEGYFVAGKSENYLKKIDQVFNRK